MSEFSQLKGKTITAITGATKGSEEILFTCSDATTYKMHHHQDCCEGVDVEDVAGNLDDIINSEVLVAEESSSDAGERTYDGSGTWTFYKIDTAKGGVTIRWLGVSNGYYSESVDFHRVDDKNANRYCY